MTLCLLSLINISPIAAALAHKLDFKDLKHLILVSHAFHDNLIPYMYQLPLQLSHPPVLSDALAGIERYGGYLGDFWLSSWVPANCREQLKEALGRHCRRLRVLHLDVTHSEIASSALGSVVSLTRNNAGSLVELMIEVKQPRKKPRLKEAWPLRFIENCRHLAVLRLTNCSLRTQPITLDTVLAFGRCCPNLVELEIQGLKFLSRTDVHGSSLQVVANHSSAVCSSSSSNMAVAFLFLENLSLGETDDNVLVPLVQHCPSLTSISFEEVICSSRVDLLVQTLARTCGCGKLKSFALKRNPFDKLDKELAQFDMERMLKGIARDFYRLESIDLIGFDVSEELLLTIAAFVGPRLTKLSICDSRSISAEGVAALLTQCPHLRNVCFSLEQNYRRGCNDVPMDPQVIFREPWACSATLERFTCPIGFRGGAEPEDMIYGAPGHRALERKVCAQLGRLLQIRHLDLSVAKFRYGLFGATQVYGFSWTLERGLDQLSGLQKLIYINFGLAHTELGLDELVWMKQHWPWLYLIHVMDAQGTLRDWMNENWPSVVLTYSR
ncbi:hypothetical protein DFQ27_006927 [Actinomortierella ambigua]|uniref:Uncharacterized protein n=1 Tax=Actinomortierella ambigua TaxID=1343610 RepID=A0A9P6PV19_9FUNG|nr:hypothetical protein DFQ27_006927 [Actinomortierella ambigua]